MRNLSWARIPIGAALAVLCLTSCATVGPDRETRGEDRIEDVSSVPLEPGALQPIEPVELVRRLPRVESVGDCAPRSGGEVACLEGRPCRGFGVRDEAGRILCSCYGEIGGCDEGQRCDGRKLTCVPVDEPPAEEPPSRP